MTEQKPIGIVFDEDFAEKHAPPYPNPAFLSFESPLRIKGIYDFFKHTNFFKEPRLIKLSPREINYNTITLAHTTYHIDSIERISAFGSGLLGEEIYVTKNTFDLAKKAIGGTIEAIESVINGDTAQSFGLVRPPGHHASRLKSSGLCIFNNIATAILYLREQGYDKKIAVIDIDDHFGDGLSYYFYQDPSVLYFSIHEFDFTEGDIGFMNEFGEEEGLGFNINFPVPAGIRNKEFLLIMNILDPLLHQFKPDLIIVATGFDMYFDDPIGNCFLTSAAYYQFTKQLLKIAKKVCGGKVSFILEGGYSLIGLPYCVQAIVKGLLNEPHKEPVFEKRTFLHASKYEEVERIKDILQKMLKDYWDL